MLARSTIEYVSYLLRIWRPSGDNTPGAHFDLTDLGTGRRLGFADLDELFDFLESASAGPKANATQETRDSDTGG